MALLHVEELLELLLAHVAPSHQVVAEELSGILRRHRDHTAVLEVDLLGEPGPFDDQGSRLAALGDPLEDVGEGHGVEVAADRHG